MNKRRIARRVLSRAISHIIKLENFMENPEEWKLDRNGIWDEIAEYFTHE